MQASTSFITAAEPWADQPIPLVETPMYATGKVSMLVYSTTLPMLRSIRLVRTDGALDRLTARDLHAQRLTQNRQTDVFTVGASHMALLHNAILRGFNSIYLQAPQVDPADYRDFVRYCLTWCRFVKKHHDDEEAQLFPSVENAMGVVGALDHSREEHHTFMHGLTKMNTYLCLLLSRERTCEFSAARLMALLDDFRSAFGRHFHHEIGHIAALRELTAAVCAERLSEVGAIFAAWGRKSVRSARGSDVLPFMFMNFDRTVEGGLWREWPPMPAPVRWVLVNLKGAWDAGHWKFSSCTSDGRPRALYALRRARMLREAEVGAEGGAAFAAGVAGFHAEEGLRRSVSDRSQESTGTRDH
ncbi:hypothetical protein KEM52_000775, partial [Ascosphaera acerosa]